MNSRSMKRYLGVGVLLIVLALVLYACSSAVESPSNSAVQTVVQQELQATLQVILAKTDTASQVSATVAAVISNMATATPQPTVPPTLAEAPVAEASLAPAPTATPVPEDPPLLSVAVAATAAPQPGGLAISADINTNCRSGPSTYYSVVGYLLKGASSTVSGQNSAKSWWLIQNPTQQTQTCWVWSGSTNVQGDTSSLAVVAVDPAASYASSDYGCNNYGYYSSYYGCGNNNYNDCGYNNYNSCGCGYNNYCGNGWKNYYGDCKVKRLICQKPGKCDVVWENRCIDNHVNWGGCYNFNNCNNNCQNGCGGYNGRCDPWVNYH